MKKISLLVAFLVVLLPVGLVAKDSRADDSLARFDGGIGVVPVALAGGVGVANTVRGVPPGGRPWVIADLKADIDTDGRIRAEGRGLILGGGDSIGTPDGITSVAASLFCDANTVAFSSASVPLSATGDFRIDDVLNPLPPVPCTTPVLLIRNGAGGAPGAWFAAGIPKRQDND